MRDNWINKDNGYARCVMGIEIKKFKDIKYLFNEYFIEIDLINKKVKINVHTPKSFIDFVVQLSDYIEKNYSKNIKFHDISFALKEDVDKLNDYYTDINKLIYSDEEKSNNYRFIIYSHIAKVIKLIKDEEKFLSILINDEKVYLTINEVDNLFKSKDLIFAEINVLIDSDKSKSKELADLKVEFEKYKRDFEKFKTKINKKQIQDLIEKLIEQIPFFGKFLVLMIRGAEGIKLLTSKKDKK